jgi:hypothetical protein
MVEKEKGFLFPFPLQGGEETPPARRGLKNFTWNILRVEDVFEKLGSFYLIPRRVNSLNTNVFLKMMGRFV